VFAPLAVTAPTQAGRRDRRTTACISFAAVVAEAPLRETENGLAPAADGWFVVNAREAVWWHSDDFGSDVSFESENARFTQVGINVGVLQPGQPAGCTTARTRRRTFSCWKASAS
jgi:hypothetical protein